MTQSLQEESMPVYDVAAKTKRPAGASSNGTSEGEVKQRETKAKSKPLLKKKDEEVHENPAVVEFSEPAQWVERMALTSTKSLPADLNADDDPKREEAFIQQALLSVARGVSLLEEANVPWKRPADYYAEMYKSDVQMSRIAEAMESSKTRIEARAQRRAMKDQKKYGKEVQAEVLRQRAKYKRDMGERITEWRRKRKGNGELRDILDDNENDNNNGKGGKGGKSNSYAGGRGARKERAPQSKNLRPGGGGRSAGKHRPGKNARRRQ